MSPSISCYPASQLMMSSSAEQLARVASL